MAELTPEERALIDAAVAKGKVTQVAPGTTGYPPLVWCPHRNVLIYDNPADAQRRQALENPEVRERRAKLREMVEAGASREEMRKTLRISADLLKRDARLLGLELPEPANGQSGPDEELVRQVLTAFDGKKCLTRIATEVGRHPDTVRKILKKNGLKCPAAPPSTTTLTVAQIAQRRAQVRRLIAGGMTAAETAKALGVKPATVSSDLRAMRVGITELRQGALA
ncbi:hypothetical protein CBW24_07850 [Pacificitalea manganoxidans]|uniref:Uncharacterized protein n=1 Tax=Pacificitalea manganoxidans TaxID=1411902 RepID=A0A291LYV2_9RHOB|nr:hypothetical protein [Pacificitalea manganoxidans]ATI41923.1 hypothetical protein CBW24_07850 [Pacificitalea manganoxidans]MDR6309410.1 DNA invertase Pin-like site-specific DNA recombinase [Pacificitalea manganoxidans]